MIEIIDKSKCCGCTACYSVCPRHCISMTMDEEGYLYPKVNVEDCIECGLCEKTCPIITKKEVFRNDVKAYAVQNKNEDLRKKSSSGGAFSVIAEKVIEKGGYVFGCKFDENFKVVHSCVSTYEGLEDFRGSKYVQSFLGDSFSEIKKLLKNGKLVLFSGTPCQVAGLHSFLKKEYENLLSIDLVCHGIPSPGLWNKYLSYINKVEKSKITYISFRNKKFGYAGSTMAFGFENGKFEYSNRKVQFYKHLFFEDINSRPSCFDCQFKGVKRVSDFTIYDCWHMNQVEPSWDDDKGSTWVLVQSEKGQKFFEELKGKIRYKEAPLELAIKLDGELAVASTSPNPLRNSFFDDNKVMDIDRLIEKYFPLTLKKRITFIIKPILHRFGILNKLKRLLK